MDCCHQIGIRFRERRPRAEDAMTLANRVPPCGTCGGVPHVSGLPCVCDGANTVYAEVQGLRQQLIGAQAEVGKLRRETVAQAAGWEREMDKWRARVREVEEALHGLLSKNTRMRPVAEFENPDEWIVVTKSTFDFANAALARRTP